MNVPSSPQPDLYPETVPGGSLIGSVTSQFAASFAICQKSTRTSNDVNSTIDSRDTTAIGTSPSAKEATEHDISEIQSVIQNMSRPKVEKLVTQAWIRNIPNQSEDKLRHLVTGALRKGLLNEDEIYDTFPASLISLPTHIQIRIVSYLPLRSRVVFLTGVSTQLTRLAHYPELWKCLDLDMPFLPKVSGLQSFLIKYTPSNSIEHLYFPSSTRSHEFLKLLVTLKQLKSRLTTIHLSGKNVTCLNLSALTTGLLLGKWTDTIILDQPSTKVDIVHISSLISASPRLKTFSLQTCHKFSPKEYAIFLQHLMRSGETTRLHHHNPEINFRLRTLHVSCTSTHSVSISILTELSKFFPLLEMLRIENWKLVGDIAEESVPLLYLRGLSLLNIEITDTKKTNPNASVLARYLRTLPSLEILVLGAKEIDVLGLKLPFRKQDLGKVFEEAQLPNLKVFWLRSWMVDYQDLLAVKSTRVQWVVVEQCKGLNGGWIKAVQGKWKGAFVVESDTRMNGVDFFAWKRNGKKHG